MDEGKFVTFKKLPPSSNEAIHGAVWEAWDEILLRPIGIVGWASSKTYAFAPYHSILLDPEHLEDIAQFLREETQTRGRDNARDTIFSRD